MGNLTFLILVTLLFGGLSVFSLYFGVQKLRAARRTGRPTRWYQELSILTGCEYGTLTLLSLLLVSNNGGSTSSIFTSRLGPVYAVLLIAAAVFVVLVIRQFLLNARNARLAIAGISPEKPDAGEDEKLIDIAQRKRERRKNAASARRRQSGKA